MCSPFLIASAGNQALRFPLALRIDHHAPAQTSPTGSMDPGPCPAATLLFSPPILAIRPARYPYCVAMEGYGVGAESSVASLGRVLCKANQAGIPQDWPFPNVAGCRGLCGESRAGRSGQCCWGHWPHAADAGHRMEGFARQPLANATEHSGWGAVSAKPPQALSRKPDYGFGGV